MSQQFVYTLILWFPTLRDKGVIGGADFERVQTTVRNVLFQYGVESARTELGDGIQRGADFFAALKVEVLASEEKDGLMTSAFKAIVTLLTRKPDADDGGHGLYLSEDTPSTFYKVALDGDLSLIYARTKNRDGPVILKWSGAAKGFAEWEESPGSNPVSEKLPELVLSE